MMQIYKWLLSFLIHKGQCLCVCLLYKSKLLDGSGWNLAQRWSSRGKVLGGFRPGTPTPWVRGASGASTASFGKNFIKQKLQGTPDLARAGHLFGSQIWIRKDLGPLSFWSHGHSLWRIAYKINCVVYVPNSYLMRLDTSYVTLRSRGPKRGVRWGSGASAVHFGEIFIKQKLLGTPNLVGIGHLIGPQIQIWKDLGQWLTFKEIL